ncbi:class I SAM-dependent methyltransferase [Silvibacterium acidisoli]|uniref:class I SAM-dependent methyltransferase n=1 Tax=Acidobacteriaceae bacterium ZG23-2 TaxID=2883246 RepID=UPI00406D3754
MNETTAKVREHYNKAGLLERIEEVLDTLATKGEPLTASLLAPVDQFHTRGILATADLADAVGLNSSMRVLDLGSGIGGPARYYAATYGCFVEGLDLSPSFVEAATYLTARCGMIDRVKFTQGNALEIPFEDVSFDAVFLHHVAMNIADRASLYREVVRVLRPNGKFAIHDIVRRSGELVYPAPWAMDSSTSFLLSVEETRAGLEQAGLSIERWSDETDISLQWFENVMTNQHPGGSALSRVMGADFPQKVKNLGRNIAEGRAGVLSAVSIRK